MLADYLVVDVTKPYVEQGSFLEIELAARRGEAHADLRRPDAQRRRDGHDLHAADQRRERARSSATASTSRRGPRRATFPYLAAPNPDPPAPPRAPPLSDGRATTATAAASVSLELDDIQSGALHERPSPYVGTYLLLRIDDRAAGRELVRRLHRRSSTRAARRPIRRTTPGSRSPSPITGLKALGVPQDSLDSFAPEFRRGHGGPRRASSATSARAARSNWETAARQPPTSTSPSRRSRPTPRRLEAVARAGAPRARGAARRRGDLAPGLLPAPDRADLVRLQGRHRPAGGRGQRHRRRPTRRSGRSRPARSSSAIPTRPASCRRCRRRTCSAATAPTSCSASCTPGWRPTGSTCARKAASREDEALLGAKMVGRWQSGAPLALSPGARRSRARRRPAAQQRLPLRRRSARLQVPGRRARPTGQPARRARRRGQRRRPPAPHDPARHELRPDAARRRARGRRRRPRASSSCSPARTSSASSSSSRRSGSTTASSSARPPRRIRWSDRTTDAASFTIPQRPIRRRLHDLPPFVVTRGGEYCFAPGLRALRWLARARHVTDSTENEENDMATSPTGTDRWKALDFGPPPSDVAEPDDPGARRLRLRRPRRRDHAEPAARRQRDHHRDGRAPDRDPGDDRGHARPSASSILTGAGERAFSVGSDLRQRKSMTKEDWLRQRQDFDRTLYTAAPAAQADLRRRQRDRLRRRLARSPRAPTSSSPPRTPPSASPRRCSASPPAAARRRCCRACCPRARRCRC